MASNSDETRDLRIVPTFELDDVKNFISSGATGSGKKERMRGYSYFTEGYICGMKSKGEGFLLHQNRNECWLKNCV